DRPARVVVERDLGARREPPRACSRDPFRAARQRMTSGHAGNARAAEIEVDIGMERAGQMSLAPRVPSGRGIRERKPAVEDPHAGIVEPARELGRSDEGPEAHLRAYVIGSRSTRAIQPDVRSDAAG